MRRIASTHSDSARNQFHEHLLAGRVTRFELVFAYVGLRRELSCFYTILESEATFREVPLRVPQVRFREDGQEVQLVESATDWNVMHRHFHFQFMPFLILGTAKLTRQAR